MSSEHSAAKVGEIFNKAGAAFTHLGELCTQVYAATEDFKEYDRSQMEGTCKDSTFSSDFSSSLKSKASLGDVFECSPHQDVTSTASDLGASATSENEVDVVGIVDR